jgi:hypothetical protein
MLDRPSKQDSGIQFQKKESRANQSGLVVFTDVVC